MLPTKRPGMLLLQRQTDRRLTGTTLTGTTLAVRILAVMTGKRIRAAQMTLPQQRQIRQLLIRKIRKRKAAAQGRLPVKRKTAERAKAVHRKLLQSKRVQKLQKMLRRMPAVRRGMLSLKKRLPAKTLPVPAPGTAPGRGQAAVSRQSLRNRAVSAGQDLMRQQTIKLQTMQQTMRLQVRPRRFLNWNRSG